MLKIDAFNIIATIVNLLVLFIAMRLLFFKPILNIIAKRQEEADKQFDEAAKKQEEADELKAQYESSLDNIEEEKRQVVQAARKDADDQYNKIVSEAENKADKIRQDAVDDAEKRKSQILKSAEKEIADMVVDAARKVVGTQSGADINVSLYNEFLDKAGDEQ